jgi:hypothetical protein
MTAVSKGKFNNRQALLVLILFAMMTVVSYYLFLHAWVNRHVQLDILIAATSLSLFFLFIIIIAIQELKVVDIYDEQIKVKKIWRFAPAVINKTDILLYSLSAKRNINYIIIKTANKDIILPEPLISNNAELYQQFQRWKIKRKNDIPFKRHSPIENKGAGVVLMAAGTFLLGFTIKTFITSGITTDANKLLADKKWSILIAITGITFFIYGLNLYRHHKAAKGSL